MAEEVRFTKEHLDDVHERREVLRRLHGDGELGAVYVDGAGLQEAQLVRHGAVSIGLEVYLRTRMHVQLWVSGSLHPAPWLRVVACDGRCWCPDVSKGLWE